MIKMTYPNRLVKIPDIGALAEEIGKIRGQDEPRRLELSRKLQNAERRRLAGAVDLPEIKAVDDELELYWRGGDGRDYRATLVGLYYPKSYAIVTEVTSERKENPYQIWHAKNGPWF